MDPRKIHEREKQAPPESPLRRLLRACFVAGLLAAVFLPAPAPAAAQEPAEEPVQNQAAPANAPAGNLVTVYGVVSNALTGQPLPRALVRIEGDANTGALTDGEGVFEIPGVPAGPQIFEVVKPGFHDRGTGAGSPGGGEVEVATHNVLVDAQMPKLTFALAPTSAIRGQIDLSTGDPAERIPVVLLKRTVQDGRGVWPQAAVTRTNSEGLYRFAGLGAGEYAIYTEPAMESEPATPLAVDGGTAEREGYASVFYRDARELAGAAKIKLSGGEQAQANFTLTLEPFHAVTATVTFPDDRTEAPGGASSHEGEAYSAVVMDAAGHELPYHGNHDWGSRAVKTLLPDGTYTLLLTYSPPFEKKRLETAGAGLLFGTVDFSVSGHDLPNLRVPLSVWHENAVELTIVRSSPPPAQTGATQARESLAQVMVSSTGGGNRDGIVGFYASGSGPGAMGAAFTLPGSWWVHTHIGQKGLCEQSFTAGGVNLAREPLVIGLSGSTPPMELTLRDGCAKLTLSLPAALTALAPGEEPYYTVYVVPDFDSTVDLVPVTLRSSSGGTVTLEDLTPGSYHVYAFNAPVRLEYRNPAVLAALPNPGQQVTLSPGAASNLLLEVPGP